MSEFNKTYLDVFLGIVRKYMQVRGAMSQKDLAEMVNVGVSTMSRFLGKKTQELDPQLIAQIVAKLNIPLHEIIDFVEEEYSERFVRLVKFYKGEEPTLMSPAEDLERRSGEDRRQEERLKSEAPLPKEGVADLEDTADVLGRAPVSPSAQKSKGTVSIREKLEQLTPRQKAFLNDFLDLDMEGRDLLVDLGNSIFRFFRQKGMEFDKI